MISFGKLNKVNKTYEKEKGIARGQNYEGIKFRRAESFAGQEAAEKAGKEFKPEIEGKFIFANKLASGLKLAENGFIEFTDGQRDEDGNITKVESVYLALVNDKHDDVKILKSTTKGDKKSLSVKVGVLEKDLVEAGVLDGAKLGNQYLTLVAEPASDMPDYIQALYKVVPDTSVVEGEEEEGESEEAAEPTAEVADKQDF
jgi:hypothetical protein